MGGEARAGTGARAGGTTTNEGQCYLRSQPRALGKGAYASIEGDSLLACCPSGSLLDVDLTDVGVIQTAMIASRGKRDIVLVAALVFAQRFDTAGAVGAPGRWRERRAESTTCSASVCIKEEDKVCGTYKCGTVQTRSTSRGGVPQRFQPPAWLGAIGWM